MEKSWYYGNTALETKPLCAKTSVLSQVQLFNIQNVACG